MPAVRERPSRAARLRSRARGLAGEAARAASFSAWGATRPGRANARRVAALRGSGSGRPCFVMGNGPSLLESDLERLAGELTIASNAHYLIWPQLSYVPTFLTVEDRLVAEDRGAELRGLEGPTKLFPDDLMHLLGPAAEDTLFVRFPRRYRPFPRFSDDLARRAYWGGTVSYLNLQLGAHLGCDPIVLLGFDHSYVVPEEQLDGHVIHSTSADVNHIHPDYFGPGYRWHDPDVARMEAGYRHARTELERRGVTVLNATAGGRLEVFERVALEAVVGA